MAAKSTVNLDYPPGATPLDADELASLISGHLTTQAELNEWEQLNIGEGDKWARKQRKDILSETFLRQLHRQMFGETWKWAGEFRKSDKNIGVDCLHIGVELKKLLDDVRYQIDHADLTAKLKLAVEALEHYANNAHWDEYEDEFNGESGWYSIFNKTVDFGNKVAEAALKQIGEPAKGRDI